MSLASERSLVPEAPRQDDAEGQLQTPKPKELFTRAQREEIEQLFRRIGSILPTPEESKSPSTSSIEPDMSSS